MSIAGKPRLDATRLVGDLLESILFGILIALIWQTTTTLLRRSKQRSESPFTLILLVSWLLFLSITGHWITTVIELVNAFNPPLDQGYTYQPGGLTPAMAYFTRLSNPCNIAASAFFIVAILVGDWFLIYRVYIIWGQNVIVIVLPLLISGGALASGIMVTYLFSQVDAPVFVVADRWITALFTLTVCCNIYSTAMIGIRLLLNGSGSQSQFKFRISSIRRRVVEILIQSAAIYCLVAILLLIFFLLDSNLVYIFTALEIVIIGINFCLIVIRTRHDKAPDGYQYEHSELPLGQTRAAGGRGFGVGGGTTTFEMMSELGTQIETTTVSRAGESLISGGSVNGAAVGGAGDARDRTRHEDVDRDVEANMKEAEGYQGGEQLQSRPSGTTSTINSIERAA